MKGREMRKRLLALFLCFIMVLGCVEGIAPIGASAAVNVGSNPTPAIDIAVNVPSDYPGTFLEFKQELTEKLIDELAADGADRDDICRKYQTLVGFVPDWIQRIENLLISLEMYRVQEEQAVKTLSELLSACGISMSEEEIRRTDTARVQERIKKEASL